MSDGVDLPGEARYFSGSVPAVDGAFFGRLVDNRDSRGQGSLSLFPGHFFCSGPDVLNNAFHACTDRFVAKVTDYILFGPFNGRFMYCQSCLLLSALSSVILIGVSRGVVKSNFYV